MKVSIAHIHYIAICGQMNVKDTSIHPEHPRDPPSTVAFHGLIPARPKRKWRLKKMKNRLICFAMTSKCTWMWSFLNLEKAKLWSSLNKVWSWYQWVTTTTLHYILVHGSIEEWCLRGDSLNRETSPVMSSLFLPPLSWLCTRSVHQILFYSIYQQQVLQGCNLELLICWSVVEGLKPKSKMKIYVQKLADWLIEL